MSTEKYNYYVNRENKGRRFAFKDVSIYLQHRLESLRYPMEDIW